MREVVSVSSNILYKMRLILIALFVFISSVVCINEKNNSDQSLIQGRYNFNRPPWAEDYNPVPVPVIYEDDTITGKSIKPEGEKNSKQKLVSDIKEVSQTSDAKEKPVATELIEISSEVKKNATVIKKDDKKDKELLKPKARALSDLQIPVAVVYDKSVPDNTQSTQKVQASETNSFRKRYKQVRRRKPVNKPNINNEKSVLQNTEPVKPETETKSFSKPQTSNVESIKLQQSETNSFKSQSKHEPVEAHTIKSQGKRERDPVVPIVNSENFVYAHSGNFHYSYEAGDGTKAYSEGQLTKSVNNEPIGEAVSGGFSYTDKQGNDFSLSYTADERGYRPIGAHLPTSPPIPPEIARALAYLATATTPEPVTKPSAT